MPLAAGTQVWVKCDDGEWWPAKTHAVTPNLLPFMGETEDCCAEFYHDPGQLYPVCSTDSSAIRLFHREVTHRSDEEKAWFERHATLRAVEQAMQDAECATSPSQRQRQLTTPASTVATLAAATGGVGAANASVPSAPLSGRPFSAEELKNIRHLLGAVSSSTASQLLQGLSDAGVDISTGRTRKTATATRGTRKRERAGARSGTCTVSLTAPAAIGRVSVAPTAPLRRPDTTRLSRKVERRALTERRRESASDEGGPWGSAMITEDSSNSGSNSGSNSPYRDGDRAEATSKVREPEKAGRPGVEERGSPAAGTFVECLGSDALEVLRSEVFENSDAFVLSPVYRFIEVLGAVTVENTSVHTVFPSPHGVREAPKHGFDASRRVLLVALTEDYHHTNGWMQPVKMEDTVVAMRLAVNGVSVPVPTNWPLTPAKEAAAIRSAPVADITEQAMAAEEGTFSLDVGFSQAPDDTELWRGIVACVFAEEVSLETLSDRILMNYRKASHGHTASPPSQLSAHPPTTTTTAPRNAVAEDSAVNVTEGYVKLQCPLTTMPMAIPARGVACEHLQCVEMAALLTHCVRSNLWNCPLCGASVKPRDVWVNYRLKEWIEEHRGMLSLVEYVMETAPGSPIKVQLRRNSRAKQAVDVDDVDNG